MISTTTTTTVTTPSAGSNVAVPFPQRFDEEEHLVLYRVTSAGVRTTLTEGVHYSVAGTGNEAGGTITVFTVAAGDTIIASREVDITQQQDYVSNDRFPAAGLEGQLDKQIQIDQQLNNGLGRAIKVLPGEPNPVVSARADREETIMVWDNNGDYTEDTPAQLWSRLPVPPGTVSGLGMVTFPDAAARANATYAPDFAGQYATQLDTGEPYIATGIAAGNWTPLAGVIDHATVVETEAELAAAITAIGSAEGQIIVRAPITITTALKIPKTLGLRFLPDSWFDFASTATATANIEIDGTVDAKPGWHIFRNTVAGSVTVTPGGIPRTGSESLGFPSVYGAFGNGTRFLSWWCGKPDRSYGTYVDADNPGNYNQTHFQAAIDSGYTTTYSATITSRHIVELTVDGWYFFNDCTVTLSNRRAHLNAPNNRTGSCGIKVDIQGGGTMSTGDFVITMSNPYGAGFFEQLNGIYVTIENNETAPAGDIGCVRLTAPYDRTGDVGLQEFSRIIACNFVGFSGYGVFADQDSTLNGFRMRDCQLTSTRTTTTVPIYLKGPARGGRFESSHAEFSNITINPVSSTGQRIRYAIVNERGGTVKFDNIHTEDCAVSIKWGTTTANYTGMMIVDSLTLGGNGSLICATLEPYQLGNNFSDGDTITIVSGVTGERVTKIYTWRTAAPTGDEVLIGSRYKTSINNLKAAIEADIIANDTKLKEVTELQMCSHSAVLEFIGPYTNSADSAKINANITITTTASTVALAGTPGQMARFLEMNDNNTAGAFVSARHMARTTGGVAAGYSIYDHKHGGYSTLTATDGLKSVDRSYSQLRCEHNTGVQRSIAVAVTGTIGDIILPYAGPNCTYVLTPSAATTIAGMEIAPIGTRVKIINTSLTTANTITLLENAAGGTVSLRFRMPNSVNYVLTVKSSVTLRYETSIGWVVDNS
jgi:hypothetical protein